MIPVQDSRTAVRCQVGSQMTIRCVAEFRVVGGCQAGIEISHQEHRYGRERIVVGRYPPTLWVQKALFVSGSAVRCRRRATAGAFGRHELVPSNSLWHVCEEVGSPGTIHKKQNPTPYSGKCYQALVLLPTEIQMLSQECTPDDVGRYERQDRSASHKS